MAEAPVLSPTARAKKVKLDDAAFGARFKRRARARERARRAGRAPPRHGRDEDARRWSPAAAPSRGARRAPAAPAPARTARRCGPAAAPSSAREPRSYTFKVNRKEHRAALRSALSLHAERGSLAVLDAAAFEEPKTQPGARAARRLGARRARRSSCVGAEESAAALSFRNLARVAVLTPENVGVTDLVGAASLVRLRAGARRR